VCILRFLQSSILLTPLNNDAEAAHAVHKDTDNFLSR
jgi:hypothetical protein